MWHNPISGPSEAERILSDLVIRESSRASLENSTRCTSNSTRIPEPMTFEETSRPVTTTSTDTAHRPPSSRYYHNRESDILELLLQSATLHHIILGFVCAIHTISMSVCFLLSLLVSVRLVCLLSLLLLSTSPSLRVGVELCANNQHPR